MVIPAPRHPVGVAQHIVLSTIERQPCFGRPSDYASFLRYLQHAAQHYQIRVHAWVVLPNHCHLLLTAAFEPAVEALLERVSLQYGAYLRGLYSTSTVRLQKHYLSSSVAPDQHLLRCARYIEANPVRAALVSTPADYRWSSFGCSALGVKSRLWSPHPAYLELGADAVARRIGYRLLCAELTRPEELRRIRASLYQGRPYGCAAFIQATDHLGAARPGLRSDVPMTWPAPANR